jgi:UTP-glucose-1-phosphate uridylyltransferase
MKVIIPAAGLGTRFASLNLGMAKELLPLGGTPVIVHALAEAARAGFDGATIVLSPNKDQVRDFLLESKTPIPVEFVVQPKPLGVGDAVLRGWQGMPAGVLLPDDVVLSSTHWATLLNAHYQDGSAALCVRPVPTDQTSRFGIAECDGDRVTGLVEKPRPGTSSSNLAIFGRYIVTEAVIDRLRALRPNGELELTDGFGAAVSVSPGVRAVWFEDEIYDCGTPDAYAISMNRFAAVQAAAIG